MTSPFATRFATEKSNHTVRDLIAFEFPSVITSNPSSIEEELLAEMVELEVAEAITLARRNDKLLAKSHSRMTKIIATFDFDSTPVPSSPSSIASSISPPTPILSRVSSSTSIASSKKVRFNDGTLTRTQLFSKSKRTVECFEDTELFGAYEPKETTRQVPRIRRSKSKRENLLTFEEMMLRLDNF